MLPIDEVAFWFHLEGIGKNMAAAVGCWSQPNDLRAQLDWAVILIFGDVVKGGVDRHVQSL